MSTQFVIYSEELGIYLGHCMGLGFWSKLDPVGQPCAVTFSTIYEAHRHVASWNSTVNVRYIPVKPDDPSKCQGRPDYASVAACVAAGLPAWNPDGDKEQASA